MNPKSPPDTDPDERAKPIFFTSEDRELILSLYTLESEIEKSFTTAPVKGKGVLVPLNAYDLDELLGQIAAVANHEKDRKLQRKLDKVFARVSQILDTTFPQ